MPILIVIVASWVFSVFLALSLWRSAEPRWFKVIASIALALPVFGPFLYFFLEMPPKAPIELRATMNHYGQGGRFSGFGSKQFDFDTELEEGAASGSPKAGKKTGAICGISGWRKTGLTVAFILLVIYWAKAISYFTSGDPWGHSNYWGQAVGTLLLFAVLVTGSITFLVVAWRFWISKYFQTDIASSSKGDAGPTRRLTRTRRKRRAG